MILLVSACLLGLCTRYDGLSKPCEKILKLREEHHLIPVCPEQLGGLSTPRLPCEINEGRVMRKDGLDMSEAFEKGAREALKICRLLRCDAAILKSLSPSCGYQKIYDGSFTKTSRAGNGVFARLLLEEGIPVYDENSLDIFDKQQL